MTDDNGDIAGMVTAIVPAYERPDYVVHAIRSALAQTYPHVQVLVGDDSRADAVADAVRAIADPRVHYHRNRPSLGAMGNWIDLVHRAPTEFVASLNDDDAWAPTFLERTVAPMLADPTIGLSFCDATYVDEVGTELPDESAFWSQVSHRDVLPTGPVDPSPEAMLRMIAVWNSPQPAYAAVLRRALVASIDFPPATDPCHDLWCTYRMWTNGARFHYVNERLTYYRVHGGNLTNAGFAAAEDFIFGVIDAEQPDSPARAEMRRRWARIRFSRAMRNETGIPAAAQDEFAAARRDLDGWRNQVARVGASSPLACRAIWAARAAGRGALTRVRR